MDSKVVQWVTRSTPLESRGTWKRFVQERKGFDKGGLATPKRGLVDEPGSYAGNPYANSPKFKKFLKEYSGRPADAIRDYERMLSIEGRTVGIRKLYEALGPDNPYTFETFNNIFSRADKKITKNMSNKEKNYIKAGQRLKKIIIDNIGEPELLGDIQKEYKNLRHKKTSTVRVWNLNKSKIKRLNKALNKNYNVTGFRENTIDNVFKLIDDKDFMKSLKAYKGGKIDETSPLFKTLFKAGSGDMPYAYMTLGRALRGEIAMEGIKKDKALGNKIIKSISGDFQGPLGTAAKRWAKFQMAKHFDDPKASYDTIAQTIKSAFKDAGVKNIHIDEIFPARTGQITIGKGSGAYNQIVQFIDADINTGAKRAFDGRASKRYQLIIDAYKNKNFDKVKQLVDAHQTDINNFYKRNPEAKGKVKLTQLDYDPETKKFTPPKKIYGTRLSPKILSDMDKFYKKTGLSLDVGSTMTLEKVAQRIKQNPNEIYKIYQEAGIGTNCSIKPAKKAEGGRIGFKNAGLVDDDCMRNAIEKNRMDLKSNDPVVAAKARKSMLKVADAGKKSKTLGTLMRMGNKGRKILSAALTGGGQFLALPGMSGPGSALAGAALEYALEAGTYDWYMRKGYTHDEAFAETFLPKVVAKRMGVEKTGTGSFEDTIEYIEDKVAGTEPASQRYLKNKRELEGLLVKQEQLTNAISQVGAGDPRIRLDSIEGLKDQLSDVNKKVTELYNKTKPGTSDYQSFMTRREKRDLEEGMRAREYAKSGPFNKFGLKLFADRDFEKEQLESFYDYQGVKPASPLYRNPIDNELKEDPLYKLKDSILGIPLPTYVGTGYGSEKEVYDNYKDIYGEMAATPYFRNKLQEQYLMDKIAAAGGVANMAGGGIAGIRRPHAIPPKSGPMPQGGGLSSMFNRVRKW